MARLRLLFALLLVALGSTAGAFALSGYFEPHMQHGQPVPAAIVMPEPAPKPQLAVPPARKRFVATDANAAAPPARPKIEKASPTKKQPAAEKKTPAGAKRRQRAAAPWPWGAFSN